MADPANTGIYEIVNLVNGKRYIGSAINFRKRWAEHRRNLRRGTHHSVALQRAWIIYGETQFEFRIIQTCNAEHLIALEQIELGGRSDYNICKIAGSTFGIRPSAETRAKMSARLLGNQRTKGIKYSPEICARMGAGKVGKKRPPRSDEHRRRISESNKGHKRSLGRKVSSATRGKIAFANIGKRQTLETRLKRCTLTEDQVRLIRRLRQSGQTYRAISAELGIKRQLVGRVCMRERYEWVDPEQGPIVLASPVRGWKWARRKATLIESLRNDEPSLLNLGDQIG